MTLAPPFLQLRVGLSEWRRMGHGLWPIRHWPDYVLENYLMTLQELADCRHLELDDVPFVHNGRDLVRLIKEVLCRFRIPMADGNYTIVAEPALLLESILFALIGLVYPEEPGMVTIEKLLTDL